ncbi:hypothetical protein M9458_022816, partial [Cirrhinus mrigala]
ILIFPPICKHTAAPAHHQPASSTCCSYELTPSGPPSLTPILQSSSLILSPEPAARSRTPATAPRSSKPATAPCSGFMASNMASHIYHKDIMDQFGLLSTSSLLVPSSPPLSLLVPSRPPKSPLVLSSRPEPELPPERRPEPELPPERRPEPELPPERRPEPELPPERRPEPELPPERPPEPELPPERPPVPAPPELPPVPAPPKPGLPVLSWADNTLSFPKKILGRGATPLIHHGHLDCALGHGFQILAKYHAIDDI